jgi:hypothetical protein
MNQSSLWCLSPRRATFQFRAAPTSLPGSFRPRSKILQRGWRTAPGDCRSKPVSTPGQPAARCISILRRRIIIPQRNILATRVATSQPHHRLPPARVAVIRTHVATARTHAAVIRTDATIVRTRVATIPTCVATVRTHAAAVRPCVGMSPACVKMIFPRVEIIFPSVFGRITAKRLFPAISPNHHQQPN